MGGELEIDHFHPLAAGGSDDVENLVYACTACNRFKGDYAPHPMLLTACGFFALIATISARTSRRRCTAG
ncbi:HNH endonuclease [Sorangium sp. So ce136]|uniref:HNH endonuclease n=1 Tax=Sorangium sp. So ce136 TaxID=3133284 RepID=UPI003F521007